MSYGLFEDLHAFDEGHRIASRKGVAVATKRVADQFGAFVASGDRDARLALVEDEVRQVVADVVEEYALDTDVEALQETILEHLKGDGVTDIDGELADAPSAVGSGEKTSNHKPDCSCGFCANKGSFGKDEDDDKKDKSKSNAEEEDEDDDDDDDNGSDGGDGGSSTASVSRTADADRDGGGAVKTVDLPKGDNTGLGGPSPKIDHKTWKPNALESDPNLPDVPEGSQMEGSPQPTERQDVYDTPDYEDDFLRDTDAVTESQDLPSANDEGQSTHRNLTQPSEAADQWTGTEGLASPVSSQDPEKNPLRDILTDMNYDYAIDEYEANNE